MSEYISAELRRRVREHFSDCCSYCHTAEHLTVVTFEIEHITPTSALGSSLFENLLILPNLQSSQIESNFHC